MRQIGHRGGAGELPENTQSAFKNAIALGLDMIEFDVHRTSDGNLVIHHDYSTLRQTGVDKMIHQSTLDDLKELDIAAYKTEYPMKESMMTLDQVFDLLPETMEINVEIKNMTAIKTDIATLVVEAIHRHDRLDTVVVSAFDHEILKEVAALEPKVKIGLLLYSNLCQPLEYVERLGFDVYSIHPAIELVDENFIKTMVDEGYKVYVYTVNNQLDFDLMVQGGASGVFTDYPGLFSPLRSDL